ncbi:hypothetical protein GCM10023322_29100 [Rugosimonospora acidiphila]|uniref:Carboxymuconolactone decarboxylase family protein n=1 Tax=Rugosimonospora acidiphila TaxID=556531 RepID=A0ABP9RR68_9ACTN
MSRLDGLDPSDLDDEQRALYDLIIKGPRAQGPQHFPLTAAYWDSRFERDAHEAVGRAIGLTEAEIEAIRSGLVPDLVDPRERACAGLAHAMTRGSVCDEDWSTWSPLVGVKTVFELSTLVGYYAALALQLRVFRLE